MQLHNVPWLKTLLCYVVLVTTFLLYGRSTFYRDPGSMFFDEPRAFERKYSNYRLNEIETFTNEVATSDRPDSYRAGVEPLACASFLSVKRQGTQYVPLAAASVIQGLSPCERRDLFVDILLAHTNTTQHPSSQLPWLSNLVDSMHGYDVSADQMAALRAWEEQKDFSSKAIFDYVYALDSCYKTRSPWVIVFEDDIILADGWFVKTIQALQNIQNKLTASDNSWLFMRLFNQERSIGWGSKDIGQNHEILISILVIIPMLFSLITLRRKNSTFRRHLDNPSIAIICLLFVPTFVILFFKAGKASMLPPRPGVRKEGFGCCSQALVFPRTQVPRVKEYLLSKGKGQIDMILDELAVNHSLDRYALYPVQAQHIGQRSVRGTLAREAQAIWSMAFEDLKPKKLQALHAKLSAMIYGEKCTPN